MPRGSVSTRPGRMRHNTIIKSGNNINIHYSSADGMNQYIFTQDYVAQNRKSTLGNGAEMRVFKNGERVAAMPYTPSNMPAGIKIIPSILVDDKYIVPLNMVSRDNPVQAVPVSANGGPDLVASVKGVTRDKSFQKGALLGAAAGALYGFAANKSVFVCTIVGMLGGGLCGKLFIGKKAKQDALKAKLKEALGDMRQIVTDPEREVQPTNSPNMTLRR